MTNFIIGVVVGIVLATVGVQGVTNIAVGGVAMVQSLASAAAQAAPAQKQ
jgi:type III secretory pathway component EscR